jgi:phosphatidylserine/phosphatidylglycerophosphate/cardiolipin synthase-like enzyme
MQWISRLSAHELQIIIDGIEDGSLRAPFTELGVARIFGPETGREVCLGLNELVKERMTEQQVASVLRLVQGDRRSRALTEISDQIDLVWTGPETAGTINRDTKVVVQELFRQARHSVLIAGFAVYQGKEVFRTLANSMDANPDLKVDMYLNVHRRHRDTTRPEDLVKRFAEEFVRYQWNGQRRPNVYYDPRSVDLDEMKRSVLHAKCIVVDREISFVTSANFTEAAQERNIEAGVLVKLPGFSQKLQDHFEALRVTGFLKDIVLS